MRPVRCAFLERTQQYSTLWSDRVCEIILEIKLYYLMSSYYIIFFVVYYILHTITKDITMMLIYFFNFITLVVLYTCVKDVRAICTPLSYVNDVTKFKLVYCWPRPVLYVWKNKSNNNWVFFKRCLYTVICFLYS